MSHRNRTILVVLADPENIGLAVGISLLSSKSWDLRFDIWGRHHEFSNSGLFPFGRTATILIKTHV